MAADFKEPTLQSLQQELTIVRQDLTALHWLVNEKEVLHLRAVFSRPTLAEAAESVVRELYALSRRDLQGLGLPINTPGRRSLERQRAEMTLDTARQWLICLVRQCEGHSLSTFKQAYPWCNHRMWHTAQALIEAISRDDTHPERPRWVELLGLLRSKLVTTNQSTDAVDNELYYATTK